MALNTTPTDFFLVKQGQLAKFTGTQWQGFGDVLGTSE
jgi:branched-chain amino acid transport system substrate-binding protein